MEKLDGRLSCKESETRLPSSRHPGCSRRRFLRRAGGLALAAAGAPVWMRGTPPSAPAVSVGAHVWVYAAKLPDYDVTPRLEEIFADMKAAGMEGVELMHNVLLHDDAVERIGEISARHGLPVSGTSFEGAMWKREEHGRILDNAEVVTTRLAALGGSTFGTSVGHAPERKTAAQLDAQAELLEKIIPLCRAKGITLNLHNHTYEVVDGMHDLRGTLARIPDVPLGPDLNWLIRAGVDPVAFLHEFGSQVVFLHLRDQNTDGRWSEAMGEGATDFRAIAAALKTIPFRGHANIELAHESDFVPTRSLRESLKMSREYVREVFGY